MFRRDFFRLCDESHEFSMRQEKQKGLSCICDGLFLWLGPVTSKKQPESGYGRYDIMIILKIQVKWALLSNLRKPGKRKPWNRSKSALEQIETKSTRANYCKEGSKSIKVAVVLKKEVIVKEGDCLTFTLSRDTAARQQGE